jgi:polyhydroxyalkanoate synthesis regulator phasin
MDSNDQSRKMGDTLKKILATGVSAAFMTEESIRKIVSDLHLPKETLNLLLQGAARSKEELMNRVSREVISIISKIDFVKEASRFVEEHKFRIVAEVEVISKSAAKKAGEAAVADEDPTSKVEIKL